MKTFFLLLAVVCLAGCGNNASDNQMNATNSMQPPVSNYTNSLGMMDTNNSMMTNHDMVH